MSFKTASYEGGALTISVYSIDIIIIIVQLHCVIIVYIIKRKQYLQDGKEI